MKLKKIAALALSAVMMCAVTFPAYAEWHVTADGSTAYYSYDDTGVIAINNWVRDYDGTWTAVDSEGWVIRDEWIHSHDDYWYYVNEYGSMLSGADYYIPYRGRYYDMQLNRYVYDSVPADTYHFMSDGHYEYR